MTDNMTPNEGSALSERDAVEALAALRPQKEAPKRPEKAEVKESDEEPELESQTDTPEPESESTPEEESVIQITLPTGEKITAEEAVKGYLRESDYTRKRQADSQAESQRQAQFAEAMKQVQGLYQQIESLGEQEPDWVQLAATADPQEYLTTRAKWDNRKAIKEQAQRNLEQWQKNEMQKAWTAARNELMSGSYDPTWKDAKGFESGLKRLEGYAESLGFGSHELAGVTDPRLIVMFDKARRFDELQATKVEAKKVVQNKPKPIVPGAKADPKNRDRAALNRFHQTKTVEDGMAALKALKSSVK